MKKIRITIILSVLMFIFVPVSIYAQNAHDGDKMVTCDKDGQNMGDIFTNATVTVTDLDESGNFYYHGIDVGIFKRISDTQGQNIYVERIMTNGTKIQIVNFGSLTSYEYENTYTIAYRILYQVSGTPTGQIITSEWKKVKKDNQDIYFKVKPPIEISQFTDRVTGTNKWMDADGEYTAAEKELNRYWPDSEVVCKVEIDPKGTDIDSYRIELDVDQDGTLLATGAEINYIKVIKIDYTNPNNNNTTTEWGPEDEPNAADKPLCKNSGQKTISLEIDDPSNTPNNKPQTKKVTVYFKYKLKNNMSNIPDHFVNKIRIIPVVGGVDKDPVEKSNTIYLRKVKGQYM